MADCEAIMMQLKSFLTFFNLLSVQHLMWKSQESGPELLRLDLAIQFRLSHIKEVSVLLLGILHGQIESAPEMEMSLRVDIIRGSCPRRKRGERLHRRFSSSCG